MRRFRESAAQSLLRYGPNMRKILRLTRGLNK